MIKGNKVRIKIPLTVSNMPEGVIGELIETKASSKYEYWEIQYLNKDGRETKVVLSTEYFEPIDAVIDFTI